MGEYDGVRILVTFITRTLARTWEFVIFARLFYFLNVLTLCFAFLLYLSMQSTLYNML